MILEKCKSKKWSKCLYKCSSVNFTYKAKSIDGLLQFDQKGHEICFKKQLKMTRRITNVDHK